MILFIDTETTGLFSQAPQIPFTDNQGRPYMLEVGMVLIGGESWMQQYIVSPRDGVAASQEAINTHGITKRVQSMAGKPINFILNQVWKNMLDAELIVAHNAEFDRNIIAAEFERAGLKMPEIKWFCTRDDIGDITGDPAPEKQKQYRPDVPYRLLSLNALHQFLFDEPAQKEGAIHSAKDDAVSVARIFHELVYRRVIDRNFVNELLM